MTAPLFVGTPGTVLETVFANLHRALIDDIQAGRADEAYQRTVGLVRFLRDTKPRPMLHQIWPLKGLMLFVVVMCLSWLIWRSDDRVGLHRVVTSAGVVVAGVDVGNDGVHPTRLVDREVAAAEANGPRAGVRRP